EYKGRTRMASRATTTLLLLSCAGSMLPVHAHAAANPSKKEARVTEVIREVKLLPPDLPPRPVLLDEHVREGIGVRTGGESRAELTFLDLTITRLGANTLY